MFTIEDDRHAEIEFGYETFELALAEIRRRVAIPWDEPPNRAPCTSWRTCGRSYGIAQYDDTTTPCTWHRTKPVVKIDAAGVRWELDFAPT